MWHEGSGIGSPPPQSDRLDFGCRIAGLCYLIVALLIVTFDIGFILRHYTRFPFGDHWIWLAVLYERGACLRVLL